MALNLTDDSEATITTTVGNALFPSGAVTVANNGGIIAAAGEDLSTANTMLPNASWNTALLPFWDDIDADTGNVYWEERLVGGINTLVVQWDQRPHFSNVGSATFQLQLFESGSLAARFVYPDVDFGNAQYNFGASATIGVQETTTLAHQFSFNAPVLANGDVIDIVFGTPTVDVDEFQIDLSGLVGTSIDVVVSSLGNTSFAGQTVELLDGSNTVVASSGATNFDLGILDYNVVTSGVHTVRVSTNLTSEYAVIVTEDLVYDTESNNDVSVNARSLNAVTGALGYLSGETVTIVQSNNPSLFVDIASTGQALTLTDDSEVTINTTVGNSLLPAGSVTVANNGGILAGAGRDLSAGNGSLPSASFGGRSCHSGTTSTPIRATSIGKNVWWTASTR